MLSVSSFPCVCNYYVVFRYIELYRTQSQLIYLIPNIINFKVISLCKSTASCYDLLNQYGNPYAYDYADGSKTGELTEKDIEDFLTSSIDSSTPSITIRDITIEESKARRIDLTNIDLEKEFSLQIGDTTYTFATARTAGYVKGNATNGYYVDLTNVSRSTSVDLTYWQL